MAALSAPKHREAGQAFPIYIVMVASLLFLAFVYFAVGQASMKKNEAQTAADAAALAAAQGARDGLRWPALFDLVAWKDLIEGRGFGHGSCAEASTFAGRNGASVDGCESGWSGGRTYTVKVRTDKTVGDSVIESTKSTKATATATAVIEPRCRIEEDEGRKPEPSPTPSPGPSGQDGGEEEDEGGEEVSKWYKFVCDDRDDISIDPEKLDDLPSLADLFSVHLTGQ
ncbi:pilus assembly protein TadG-related protein [Streptomyces sp. NPDC050504]|uniref:pilus assembly protein TadG-related protein n=1 Tax=Streptomyces sp. NPDC050504 TaxID=3365618 RepID=UPI003793E9C0